MMPFFIAVALQDKTPIVASSARTRKQTIRNAAARYPGCPIFCSDFAIPGIKNRVSVWLANNDIIGKENTRLLKDIWHQLKQILNKSMEKRHG